MQPPERFPGFHAQVVTAVAEGELATHYYAEGVDESSATKIERAGELFRSCGAKVGEVELPW